MGNSQELNRCIKRGGPASINKMKVTVLVKLATSLLAIKNPPLNS